MGIGGTELIRDRLGYVQDILEPTNGWSGSCVGEGTFWAGVVNTHFVVAKSRVLD